MESLTAFLVAASVIAQMKGAQRAAIVLFGIALLLTALLLRFHATDTLPLNF